MMTSRFGWIAVLSCICIGLVDRPGAAQTTDQPAPPETTSNEKIWPVQAMQIVFDTHDVHRAFSGTVSSPSAMDLSFNRAGCIRSIHADVQDGATATGGALLFELDDREAQISMTVAQASANEQSALVQEKSVSRQAAAARYERQEASLQRAMDLLARDQGLADRNLISTTVVEDARRAVWEQEDAVAEALDSLRQAEAAVLRSEATLARVAAEVDKAALVVDLHRVKAPFDGVLVEVLAQTGDCITAGQKLATLARGDDREVDFYVPLSVFNGADGLKPELGMPATIEKATGKQCDSTISSIAGVVLPESQLVAVSVTVDPACAASLLINEAVRVNLLVQRLENVAALPVSALREGKRVFIITPENRLRAVSVTSSDILDGVAYVAFDPEDAALVVTRPPALAIDGMAVTVSKANP